MHDLEIAIETGWLATKKYRRCLALKPTKINVVLI
jgi:hypothetical protein